MRSGHHGSRLTSSPLAKYSTKHHVMLPGRWSLPLCRSRRGCRTSFSDALPELVWCIAFLISSMVGGSASESCIGCWWTWFSALVLTHEGLLIRLLKCSCQRLLRRSWSLIRVEPSEANSGEQPAPKIVFSDLKNFLELWVSA